MIRRSKTILIIEDDEDIRRTVRALLEGAGYMIREAEDGDEGEKRIVEEKPDLVLLDLRLPGRTGEEVLKALDNNDIPVVVLTGTGSVAKQLDCLKAGAVGYMSKPFLAVELLKTVKKFI